MILEFFCFPREWSGNFDDFLVAFITPTEKKVRTLGCDTSSYSAIWDICVQAGWPARLSQAAYLVPKKRAKKTCWTGSNLTKAREALMKLLIPPVAKLGDLSFVWEILRPPQPKSRWFFFVWGTVKWVATQFFAETQIMWAFGEDCLTLCKDPWDDWYLPTIFRQKSTKCTKGMSINRYHTRILCHWLDIDWLLLPEQEFSDQFATFEKHPCILLEPFSRDTHVIELCIEDVFCFCWSPNFPDSTGPWSWVRSGPQGFVGNSLFFEICDDGGGWLGENWRNHGENAATTRWVPTNSQMEL